MRSTVNAKQERIQKKKTAMKGQKMGMEMGVGDDAGVCKPAAEFEMLSPGWALFTVNGEIESVAYLMGSVFIVQHWIINWEAVCHIDLSFN